MKFPLNSGCKESVKYGDVQMEKKETHYTKELKIEVVHLIVEEG